MRLCKICTLPPKTRAKIDAALVDGITYTRIAARFSSADRPINKVNLCRHRKHLLPKELIRRAPAPKPEVALTLLDRVENLVSESRTIAEAAKTGQQWIAATSALREVRCCVELLGKLSGELSSGINFNSFNFANVTEEQITAFLDAVAKRGGARLRELVMERLGQTAPIFAVNFVAPPEEKEPLFLDAPANGNGHV
jgi:hypothetical protein